MYRPLLDIDANPRPPRTMTARSSSGKPGLATPTNASRNRRISPFVASNGSPHPMARPSSPTRANMTPANGSRIPRKSGTPTSLSNSTRATSGAASPRPALPKPRVVAKSKGASPLGQPKPASPASPTINLDKELPSPPIAQVVDPFSPVKAKRTLVDATVTTPTEEKWPIIRPEIVQSSERDAASSESEKDRIEASSHTSDPHSSDSNEKSTSVEKLGNLGASSDIGCAISTSDNKALDSPLACKTSVCSSTVVPPTMISPTAVPPRDSSLREQRSSLPLPNKSRCSSENDVPEPRPSLMKPGSTKWPLLETAPSPAPLADRLDDENRATDTIEQPDDSDKPVEGTQSFETYHTTVSQQVSTGSTSTKTVSNASSFENTKEPGLCPKHRTKRLSAHTINSGLGPILTIANDADAVLLGDKIPIPEVPPIPDTVSVKSEERSLSALAGRISRQTMSKMSLTISRSATPHSSETETNEGTQIRITPIRSMQPPRRGSAESGISSPFSALQDARATPISARARPMSSLTNKRDASGSSQGKRLPKIKANTPKPYPWDVRQRLEESNIKLDSTRRSSHPPVVPPKAGQILGIHTESPTPSIRTPIQPPKDVPSFGFSKVRNSAADRSNISTSLIPSASRNHRTSSKGMGSATSPSGFTPRPTRSNTEAHGFVPSTLNPTMSTELDLTPSTQHDRRSPNVFKERQLQQPTPSSRASPLLDKDNKNISGGAAKIKAKRSFRNLFYKRDSKETLKPPRDNSSKRSSITMTGSTIAKRIRNSANFSKTTSHKEAISYHEHTQVHEPMPKVPTLMPQTSDDARAPTPSVATPEVETPSATNLESSHIIGNIIDRVRALPQNSPDRLRGLEIAEVCQTLHNHSQVMIEIGLIFSAKAMLNAIETVKAAKIAAEMTKKYARDTELHMHTAHLQVNRLLKLVESDFDGDGEIMRMIRELMRALGLVSEEAVAAS